MYGLVNKAVEDLVTTKFGPRAWEEITRAGLSPMVRGLLKGLANMFEVEVGIEQTADKANGDDHDVFVLTRKAG